MGDTQIKKFLESAEKYVNDGELVFRVELDRNLPAKELDKTRLEIIIKVNKLLDEFFEKRIPLGEFRFNVDSINKLNRLWGFKGINGQMFFNMLYNLSEKKGLLEDLNDVLNTCLKIPNDIEDAKNKIHTLLKFIENLAQLADSRRECPRKKSVLFYLSYFWQIQDPKKWPIFYNSLEITLKNLGFLIEEYDLAEYYKKFYRLNLNMEDLLKRHYPKKSNLWFVEHILWYYYQNQIKFKKSKGIFAKELIKKEESFDDFLPPIVADLDLIANNKKIEDGKKVEDIFEEKCANLFRMLGFEVEKLGKGHRDADGIALSKTYHFALVYDCKVRTNGFSLNADDERTMIEYIENNKKKLSREGIDNVYFFIISGKFNELNELSIREIKRKSGAREVIFIKAEQLLEILKKKLIDPSIELVDIERILWKTGILEDETLEELGS